MLPWSAPGQLSTISLMQHFSCGTMVVKSTSVLTRGKTQQTYDQLSLACSFQEPFEEMPEFLKAKLSSSDAVHLNRVLRMIDMERFLPRLLEMILLNVKHAEENIAEMR